MILSLNKASLLQYVIKQINTSFPDGNLYDEKILKKSFEIALKRTEFCFSKINLKYFVTNKKTTFNHLHGDQYSMFLYFFSRSLFENNCDPTICQKIFLLNKTLFGIDVFYEVELPDIFLFVHPIGTILGRAKYSNYFVVYQNCTVGSNKGIYPTLGLNFTMHPGSTVLGNSRVGNNASLGTHSLLLDQNIKTNTLYLGNPKKYYLKALSKKNIFWN